MVRVFDGGVCTVMDNLRDVVKRQTLKQGQAKSPASSTGFASQPYRSFTVAAKQPDYTR